MRRQTGVAVVENGQLVAAGDRFSVSLEHPNDRDAGDNAQFATVEGQSAGTLGARVINGQVTAAAIVGHDQDEQATLSAADTSRLSTSPAWATTG